MQLWKFLWTSGKLVDYLWGFIYGFYKSFCDMLKMWFVEYIVEKLINKNLNDLVIAKLFWVQG